MAEQTMHVEFTITRTLDGPLALSINRVDEAGSGEGYRIGGPKVSLGKLLTTWKVDERAAKEIRRYLDEQWPEPTR